MYELCSTTTITGSREAIWHTLTDVANWATWDPHEEAARIDGPFATGTTGWSKPHGGPAASWQLRHVTPGESWSTQCPLPSGKLTGHTSLHTLPDGKVHITRTMHATGPFSVLFRYYFGPRIQSDLEFTWQALQRELNRRNHVDRAS